MQISKKTVSFLSLWSNGTTSSNNSIPSFMFDGGLTLNGKAQINCEKHSLLQTSTIMNEHKNLLSLVREISSYLKKQYNKQQITLPSGNSGGDKHPYSQYFIHHSNEFSKIEKQLQSGEILAVISDLELLLNQQFFQSILADDAKDGIKTTHLVNGTKYAQQLESIKKIVNSCYSFTRVKISSRRNLLRMGFF